MFWRGFGDGAGWGFFDVAEKAFRTLLFELPFGTLSCPDFFKRDNFNCTSFFNNHTHLGRPFSPQSFWRLARYYITVTPIAGMTTGLAVFSRSGRSTLGFELAASSVVRPVLNYRPFRHWLSCPRRRHLHADFPALLQR